MSSPSTACAACAWPWRRKRPPHNVRCNLLIPGFIETPMLAAVPEAGKAAMAGRTPQGRVGQPREVASLATFLLSDDASHVTAQGWAADGGLLGTLIL